MTHRIPLLAASLLSLTVTLVPALAADSEAHATNADWLRVDVSAQRLHTLLPDHEGAIDYGRFQWLPASTGSLQVLRSAGVVITPFERAFELDLGGQRFDPLLAAPATTAITQSGETGWYLVQFRGPIKPEWLVHLRDAGATPAQYIHPYTYVVWSDAAAVTRARNLAEVRWSGAFAPEFKVATAQRHFDATSRATMVLASRHRDAGALQNEIAALGGSILSTSSLDTHFKVMHLEIPGDRYVDLAALTGIYTVQDIRPETALRGEMSGQSIVGGYGPPPTNTIVPGYQSWLDTLGFDGAGVVVAVVDGGVRTSHVDLASRMVPCVLSGATPTSCTTENNSHGTHVAGAIAGTGVSGVLLNGFLRGLGGAPGANLVQQRYNSFLGGGPGQMIADGMLKIYKESSLSGAVLTNNSWGPTGSPQGYDIPTQQIDIVTRDANPDVPGNQQILNVWSIMNGGGDGFGACQPSSLGSPDEAKNLFAVGSTSLQSGSTGAQVSNIFNVSSNSAHGNACDGRRVPNIVAPGCSTDSTASSGNTAFSYNFCGTSMASPVVSGASAVFVEKYRTEHAGATPSPAMIKAAFTAAAQDLDGFQNADGGLMGHRPDRFQGYGRIDLDAVVNSPDTIFGLDQSEVLNATGANWSGSLTVVDPLRPVRIMLAWTDAKGHGNGGSTPAWVNNLDLSVSSNGSSYRGNVIGSDGWSATGGSADDRNNLEGVFLRPDQLGATVNIEVLAANLAADALNPYTPGAPAQDFALVCYNCSNAPLGSADLALGLSALPDPVQAGDPLTILATVVNFGVDAASGIRFELALPEDVGFVSAQLQSGAGTWACSAVAQDVTCTMTAGELPTGAFSSVLEINTVVDGAFAGSSMQAAAEVGAAQFVDSLPANNQATLQIHVGDLIFAHGYE
jgi:subtilisin family serine protease